MDDAMDFTWTDVDTSVQTEINKEFEQYRNQQVIGWDMEYNQNLNINTNSGKASFYDFFVVVDTNVLLYKQKFLSELFQFQKDFKVAIVIPWIVIQELDGLKNSTKLMDNNISLSKLARSALSLILKYTVDENSNLIGQKYNEILNVGNPMFSKNDDKILDCCLYFRQNYSKDVFLLSNDKALCVKSMFSNIKVIESWEDSAEAFIMQVTSIDENKAQNIANSVRPSSSNFRNHNISNNNSFNNNSNNNNNNNNNNMNMNMKNNTVFSNYNNINKTSTHSFNQENNNNENINMNLNFNNNKNFNLMNDYQDKSYDNSKSNKNNSDFEFKDYSFGKKNKNNNNYSNFDFGQYEGYSSVDDHKKLMEEYENSIKNNNNASKNLYNFKNSQSSTINNNNNFNKSGNIKDNTAISRNINNDKDSNKYFNKPQNKKTSKKKRNQQIDLYGDLIEYSSVDDHKKLMEDYEKSLKEEEEAGNKDKVKKDNKIGIKRKQEFDNVTKVNINNDLSSTNNNINNFEILNRKIKIPTRRLKQVNKNNDVSDINNNNNMYHIKEPLDTNKNYSIENSKIKKIRTDNHLPFSNGYNIYQNNSISNMNNSNNSYSFGNSIDIHNNQSKNLNGISQNKQSMVQNYMMAVESNTTSESCTLKMISIVENYLSNGLKKFVDKNIKKNKPIPNTIPYAFPTKINDLFDLIINSWDFFQKGYPSFYENEPLTKTIETQKLINKYRRQSIELTENELLTVHKNLEQILEICEGLEGREISIKRRKELKNIKELIKKIKN
ncbi:PIN domain-containing protein [Neocallimastix sp. 'constans']